MALDRREFLKVLSGISTSILLSAPGFYLSGCEKDNIDKPTSIVKFTGEQKYKRVILLGMDGLDPKIVKELMIRGFLPNFSKLAQSGAFSVLSTSNPVQSPVAWATIATGNNAGYHGVFDFLNRRVQDYLPELSVIKRNPDNFFGRRESLFLPVIQGNSFWDYTASNGIPSRIIRWPVTFQPIKSKAFVYSGLGVPDVNGRLGTYTFYSTRNISPDREGSDKVIRVRPVGNNINTYIPGPVTKGLISEEKAKAELRLLISEDKKSITAFTNSHKIKVPLDQWSDWLEIKFKVGMFSTISGIVKFYLKSLTPEIELYMTPVQINPKDPAYVISNPDEYVQDMARDLGYFYTLGIPEDTKALSEGRLHEDAFIEMCNEITDEQEEMLWHELNNFREGVFAFGFFATDRIQHMFWSTRDKEHPLYRESYSKRYGGVITDYYRWMDRVLGNVMDNLGDKTAIMVFSDHGFSTFRRAVHINRWLVEKGYMSLRDGESASGPLFQAVDWKNTYAYSLGFGSIYINMKGREKYGIIEPGNDTRSVIKKLTSDLKRLKDYERDSAAIKDLYISQEIYSGRLADRAPDIIVGFNEGYRTSWQSALGGAPEQVFIDNENKWSGDHIVDPSIVPGILFSNFKLNRINPSIIDIAPTVLSCFGMYTDDMQGVTLI
jgi:predicted AlkP superfamily phosphohydrolase/phosphomutase